jgi:putative ABC transport system permease protein
MIEILRNMSRRKLRSTLTLFGIVIGMLAVTVMGSMSEYLTHSIGVLEQYMRQQVTVQPKRNGPPLGMRTVTEIQKLTGVRDVTPGASIFMDVEAEGGFGTGVALSGMPVEAIPKEYETIGLNRGRWPDVADNYAIVIGSGYAKRHNLDVGSKTKFKRHREEFTVVGVLNPLNISFFDNGAVVTSLDTVQRMRNQPGAIDSITVRLEDPRQVNQVVEELRTAIPDVQIETPEEAMKELKQTMAILNLILYSGVIIAAIVGGLGITNTMYMAVAERTREIGIKKAIGATDSAVLREIVMEATTMGLLAGLIGIGLGYGLAQLINVGLGETAFLQFTVTPRLALGILTFSTVLGALAGLLPARQAVALDPVMALRTE